MKFQLKDFNILLLLGVILLVMFGVSINFVTIANSTYYDQLLNNTLGIVFYVLSLILILKTFKEQFSFAKFLYVILSIPAIILTLLSVINVLGYIKPSSNLIKTALPNKEINSKDNQKQVKDTDKTKNDSEKSQYLPIIQKDPQLIQTGDTVRFTWKKCDLLPNNTTIQMLPYYPENNTEKIPSILIGDDIQNTSTFDWKIPTTIKTSEYQIWLVNGCEVTYLEKTIRIEQTASPFLIISEPRDSCTIKSGINNNITWVSNSNSNIDIGYRSTLIGEQKNIYWITKNTQNNGTYKWATPENLSGSGWTEIIIRDVISGEEVTSGAFLID
jgi:hypothetical protein